MKTPRKICLTACSWWLGGARTERYLGNLFSVPHLTAPERVMCWRCCSSGVKSRPAQLRCCYVGIRFLHRELIKGFTKSFAKETASSATPDKGQVPVLRRERALAIWSLLHKPLVVCPLVREKESLFFGVSFFIFFFYFASIIIDTLKARENNLFFLHRSLFVFFLA